MEHKQWTHNNNKVYTVKTDFLSESFEITTVLEHAVCPSHGPTVQNAVPVLMHRYQGDLPVDSILQIVQILEHFALEVPFESWIKPEIVRSHVRGAGGVWHSPDSGQQQFHLCVTGIVRGGVVHMELDPSVWPPDLKSFMKPCQNPKESVCVYSLVPQHLIINHPSPVKEADQENLSWHAPPGNLRSRVTLGKPL